VIVVSDASPVANLAVVGQLELLRQLYGVVVIPPAVRAEVVAGLVFRGLSPEVISWLEVRAVNNAKSVQSLLLGLDEGEAEAIVLADELNADLLLMDEQKGRFVAQNLGLHVIGLLGVLLEAKKRGLVPALRPVVDDLIHRAGFWVSSDLYQRLLEIAAE
jgi:predicted nucleic acid-binding protein